MTTYYTAESEKFSQIAESDWEHCNARTLKAAKRMAQSRRRYQGTCAHVAVSTPDGFKRIATRYPSAGWIDL